MPTIGVPVRASDGSTINLQVTPAAQVTPDSKQLYQLVVDTGQAAGVLQVALVPQTGATYAPLTYLDSGTVTKANIKATAGNVYSLRFTNANAAVRWLQLHNKATAPAPADAAQLYFLIPAGTATQPGVLELSLEFFAQSEYFAAGIGWAVSTTATTFTDSATAADHTTLVRYV